MIQINQTHLGNDVQKISGENLSSGTSDRKETRGGWRSNSHLMHKHKVRRSFECQSCGKRFESVQADARFCSGACRSRNFRNRQAVVGAVIQSGSKVLVARRSSGEMAGRWEFPGGKVEQGERKKQALVREIAEELGIQIMVGSALDPVRFEVLNKRYILYCFFATTNETSFSFTAHDQFQWVSTSDLLRLDLAPADVPVATQVAEIMDIQS